MIAGGTCPFYVSLPGLGSILGLGLDSLETVFFFFLLYPSPGVSPEVEAASVRLSVSAG